MHEFDGAKAGRADDQVILCLDAIDLDAFLGDLGDFAGLERDIRLIENWEIVIGDNDALAADGIFGSEFLPSSSSQCWISSLRRSFDLQVWFVGKLRFHQVLAHADQEIRKWGVLVNYSIVK